MTFLILTVEFYFTFHTNRKQLKMLRYITLLVCTVGAGVGLEIIQNIVNSSRAFDINDIFCNILGSLVGVGVSSGYLIWTSKNKRPHKQSYRMDVRQSPNIVEHKEMLPEEEEYVTIEIKDVVEQV